MSVRTTIDIPEDLHNALRRRAAAERTSVRALVVGAITSQFGRGGRRRPVVAPPVPGTAKPGPKCPDRENPYDVLFA